MEARYLHSACEKEGTERKIEEKDKSEQQKRRIRRAERYKNNNESY